MLRLHQLLRDNVIIRSNWSVLVIAWGASSLVDALERQAADTTVVLQGKRNMARESILAKGASFDLIICEEIVSRTKDAATLLAKCARALTPGGYLILWDIIIVGSPGATQYINKLECFRDPAHNWAYSLEDWEAFLSVTGLEVQKSQTFTTRLTVDEWAEGCLVGHDDLLRAQALVRHAPPDAACILNPRPIGLSYSFERTFAFLSARHYRDGI